MSFSILLHARARSYLCMMFIQFASFIKVSMNKDDMIEPTVEELFTEM